MSLRHFQGNRRWKWAGRSLASSCLHSNRNSPSSLAPLLSKLPPLSQVTEQAASKLIAGRSNYKPADSCPQIPFPCYSSPFRCSLLWRRLGELATSRWLLLMCSLSCECLCVCVLLCNLWCVQPQAHLLDLALSQRGSGSSWVERCRERERERESPLQVIMFVIYRVHIFHFLFHLIVVRELDISQTTGIKDIIRSYERTTNKQRRGNTSTATTTSFPLHKLLLNKQITAKNALIIDQIER